MSIIEIETRISGDIPKCFDLSRSVDIHIKSTAKTRERAIAGRTSGLCELGDAITWEATHFGFKQQLSVQITKFEKPHFFEDTMTKGMFKSMRHEHHFREVDGKTIMTDRFAYEVPFGFIGRIFDRFILRRYLTRFLVTRNSVIKKLAESK